MLLDILHYPNPRLHLKATKIETFDDNLKQLVKDMTETMYQSNGIGLAATQVNLQKRLFVVDISDKDEPNKLQVFVNLEFLEKSGNVVSEEGCLSVPGVYDKVERAETVRVRYQDSTGNFHEETFSGLMAVCVQHENDHLDGKVFVEYLSNLKQNFIKKKLKKIYKNEQH
jgi:peptide deformylase